MKTTVSSPRASLRTLLGSAIALSALMASGNVSASPVVTGILLLDQNAGTLDVFGVNNIQDTLTFSKTFENVPVPMTIRLTVGHGADGGGAFSVTETIKNNTGVAWTDYHIAIENAPGGNVLSDFSNSTLSGFTLDPAPNSGPGAINFTGSLANGASASASFLLSLTDPGAGNSYTLDLVQLPSIQAVPVPMAVWLFGSGLLGLGATLRRKFV